jgi:hypothetical protein
MTGTQLAAEYASALARTMPSDLRPLGDVGVREAGLEIGLALAPIALSRDGSLFQFDPDSDNVAFIFPVRGGNPTSPEAADPDQEVRTGAIVDLLAFSPRYPKRWALRVGNATWLGAVEPQSLMPAPTSVWRTPLRWLSNGGRGIVLLSRDRREQYRTLIFLESIVAEDERHADELRRLLTHPWLSPPVYVRRGREVRNAA